MCDVPYQRREPGHAWLRCKLNSILVAPARRATSTTDSVCGPVLCLGTDELPSWSLCLSDGVTETWVRTEWMIGCALCKGFGLLTCPPPPPPLSHAARNCVETWIRMNLGVLLIGS